MVPKCILVGEGCDYIVAAEQQIPLNNTKTGVRVLRELKTINLQDAISK